VSLIGCRGFNLSDLSKRVDRVMSAAADKKNSSPTSPAMVDSEADDDVGADDRRQSSISGPKRVSSRTRKPNPRTSTEESSGNVVDAGEKKTIPEIPWKEFPQSEKSLQKFMSKPGEPFNGQYLLIENLPDDFDIDEFYDNSHAQRWINVCGGIRKTAPNTKPPKDPFKPSCRTVQLMISSLWFSNCGRFHIWPSSEFVFEDEEVNHQKNWIGDKTFLEYQVYPKTVNNYLFTNPHNWTYVVEKLRRAMEKHRDVSSSDSSSRRHNKNSPVKLEPMARPISELNRLDNVRLKQQNKSGKKSQVARNKSNVDSPVEDQQIGEKVDLAGDSSVNAEVADAEQDLRKSKESSDAENKEKAKKSSDVENKKKAAEKSPIQVVRPASADIEGKHIY
jgi:hypothetical protein